MPESVQLQVRSPLVGELVLRVVGGGQGEGATAFNTLSGILSLDGLEEKKRTFRSPHLRCVFL